MNKNSFHIKPATSKDLKSIVKIHKEAYGRKHFTSLLSNALLEKYYQAFLCDQCSIKMIYSKEDNNALGFSVYGKSIPAKLHEFQKNNFFGLVYAIVSNPIDSLKIIIKKIFINLKYFNHRKKMKIADFLLLSIATIKKGSGIGTIMIRDMIDNARKQGNMKLGLYVNNDNLKAIGAYKKAGFTLTKKIKDQIYMELAL